MWMPVLMFAAIIPVLLLGVIQGAPDLGGYLAAATDLDDLGPPGFLYLNLALAALIPTAGLSIWVAHRIRPRYLSSVAGGLRWKWLLRCLLVTLPVWLLYTGLGFLAEPPPASARPSAREAPCRLAISRTMARPRPVPPG